MHDQFRAMVERSINLEATGGRAALESYIAQMNRDTKARRERTLARARLLLAAANAQDQPNQVVVNAYSRLIKEIEDSIEDSRTERGMHTA